MLSTCRMSTWILAAVCLNPFSLFSIVFTDHNGLCWSYTFRWWPLSTLWVDPFIFSSDAGRDVWITPSSWFVVMCCMLITFHVSSWIVTNISESSLLFSQYSLRFCWKQTHRKYSVPIFGFVLQNFADGFPYILCFSYHFVLLSSGWFVIVVCGSTSVQGTCWVLVDTL